MPTRCPTRRPRTGSPTWRPGIWTCRCTSCGSLRQGSSTRRTRTTACVSDGCHRRHRGSAGLPVLDGKGGVRPAGPVIGLPAVHRYRVRHLLVHRGGRPDPVRGVLGQRRGALCGREMDARPGDHRALPVAVPRPVVLLAAAGRAGRAVAGQCLAVRPGALAPAGRDAARACSPASTRPTFSPSSSGTRWADRLRRPGRMLFRAPRSASNGEHRQRRPDQGEADPARRAASARGTTARRAGTAPSASGTAAGRAPTAAAPARRRRRRAAERR